MVIAAVALLVIVAMTALVIDGGYAWAKQRDTQNAADAAADAGATVLMQNLAGVSPTKTDSDVQTAVNQAATENGAVVDAAYYTNVDGQLLDPGGALAPDESSAAQVGAGSIPSGGSGVRARVSQAFSTLLARAVGFNTLTARALATAVSGYLKRTCAADAGCIVLPLTFPVTTITCDGSNKVEQISPPQFWPAPSGVTVIPLCSSDPGNVGWLDWTPPGGGASELGDAITSPNGPPIGWPEWYYVTQTGGPDSVEGAMRTWNGKVVLVPLFDNTCDQTPSGPGINDCPVPPGGNGQNQWYHFAAVTAFELCGPAIPECVAAGFQDGAYIQGSNGSVCQVGNGATDCLVGRFVRMAFEGEVTAVPGPDPSNQALGVQLIH